MATITEKIDGRRFTRDVNGTSAATRTFIVLNAANEHSARVAFEELPDHKQFPGAPDPKLVLDRIDIDGRGGQSHYIVTATYSTFKGGTRFNDPSTINVRPFFGWERVKAEVAVPWCWQEITITGTDEMEQSTFVWGAGERAITERRIRRTLRVEFFTDQTRELDIIADQEDNIHLIQGTLYHFIGADVQQDGKDQTRFVITYTWEWDRGTYMPNDGNTVFIESNAPLNAMSANPDVAYIPLRPGADRDETGGVLVRRPYYRLDLIANQNPGISPRCVEWSEFFVDENGWRGLPGMIAL